MSRIFRISAVLVMVCAETAFAQQPPMPDTLPETVARSTAAMASVLDMLIAAYMQRGKELDHQRQELEWYRAYFKGLVAEAPK